MAGGVGVGGVWSAGGRSRLRWVGVAVWQDGPSGKEVPDVAKKKRKRRARAKSKANHGKRPNT
ncbi:hypothetical protein FsymDg_0968 [Candidatus Protofrankia datiscae]|uniref:Uncharacterized protein n=1 Tax=Candidatus Protofrankia datiscae TaxID=2716812 RepID=F8AXC0_9ACTN|nr:hypothetical protein FsymDg_0968 [Candidatus Protofrankia datiscae]